MQADLPRRFCALPTGRPWIGRLSCGISDERSWVRSPRVHWVRPGVRAQARRGQARRQRLGAPPRALRFPVSRTAVRSRSRWRSSAPFEPLGRSQPLAGGGGGGGGGPALFCGLPEVGGQAVQFRRLQLGNPLRELTEQWQGSVQRQVDVARRRDSSSRATTLSQAYPWLGFRIGVIGTP
jgi:hypothetical protein